MPSFYQVTRDQAEVLYGKALEFAGLTGEETVLDLYCGTGTITLCMASRAKRVIGAEIVAPAIRDAKENAARNHIENAGFFCGDAGQIAAELQKQGMRPDVITVDPRPWGRSGSFTSPATRRPWAGMSSCSPASATRRSGPALWICFPERGMWSRWCCWESVVLLERTGEAYSA